MLKIKVSNVLLTTFVLLGLFLPMQTEKQYDTYVTQFEKDIGIKTKSVITTTNQILFQKKNTVGVCYLGFKQINIDKKYLDKNRNDYLEIKSTIYHELAHCECGIIKHDDVELSDGCPASIMNTNVIPNVCLRRYWTQYVKRLKEDCNGNI